jgi:hypothetical protein
MAIFSVTEPLAPIPTGTLPLPNYAYGLTEDHDHVYVACGDAGLVVAYPQCPGTSAVTDGRPPHLTGARLAITGPNPFNPLVRLTIDLDTPQSIALTVHDLRGRRITEICAGDYPAGQTTLVWTGQDDRGRAVASGNYFLRMQAASGTQVEKIMLVR